MGFEEVLAKYHEREYAVAMGSGTAALITTLRANGITGRGIIIPQNVCWNVPYAVLASGNYPIYVDIEKHTLGIDPLSLEKRCSEAAAVIAVHAYGNVFMIDEIEEICTKRGLFLIEDAAIAQGATHDRRCIGRIGDASILSFGVGKIIDVGHGGAILTDDSTLYGEIKNLVSRYQVPTVDNFRTIQYLAKLYKDIYNEYYLSNNKSKCVRFWETAAAYKDCFLTKYSDEYTVTITDRMDEIDTNVFNRKERVKLLSNML